MSSVTRRTFFAAMGGSVAASRAFAQSNRLPIPVVGINHMTLTVSDVQRSLEFYQGLFGMPIQAWQASTPILRVGDGPQFLALGGGEANATPKIDHLCLNVEGFVVNELVQLLRENGLQSVSSGAPSLNGRPRHVRVRMRGPDFGGAPQGTPELYLSDPDGIVVQLQDASYCGGSGVLGECLTATESSPTPGLLAVRGYNHFTIFVSDVDRSLSFYQQLFGMPAKTYQGSTPLLSVGGENQFIALGSGSPSGTAANIHHACLTVENFDPERIIATLEEFGITPTDGTPGPLRSNVAMRMEDRGGAPGGTPELYFTDPDGIRIQLQDVNYCGGSDFIGDVCP